MTEGSDCDIMVPSYILYLFLDFIQIMVTIITAVVENDSTNLDDMEPKERLAMENDDKKYEHVKCLFILTEKLISAPSNFCAPGGFS